MSVHEAKKKLLAEERKLIRAKNNLDTVLLTKACDKKAIQKARNKVSILEYGVRFYEEQVENAKARF